LKLGLKQLEPTAADQFAQHASVGDRVSGRVVEVRPSQVIVELGEGVRGFCPIESAASSPGTVSGGSLAEQLAAVWKGGLKPSGAGSEPYREGQVRSFTIKSIDASGRSIELIPA
jgi:polyribonucleotide nucleotidyltransferase